MEDKISVIVPVYNVESYLSQCIDSILKQTYSNIEILLIDDGSTDKSGKICEEYANRFDNVKVFHKENGGLMSTWKYGFQYANGKYIGFVDSDDWIDADMYEKLAEAIIATGSDISICGLVKGEYIYTQPSMVFKGIMEVREIYPQLVNDGKFMGRGVIPSRVVKLFKKNIVKNAIPYCKNDITLGEDMVMNFAAFMFAKKVVFVNNYYPYHYRINALSMTQKFKKNYFAKIKLFNLQLDVIQSEEKVYDFEKQIAADLIGNTINTIEQVCCSEMPYNEKKEYIKMIVQDSLIIKQVKNIDSSAWEKRYKLYLWMLKRRKIEFLLLFGKFINIMRTVKQILKRKRYA